MILSKPAATISSMHVCPKVEPGPVPHVGGPVAQGSPNVFIGGLPAARKGDKLVCVGPPDEISGGSSGVFINGKPATRLGDSTQHGGKIVVGNPTVLIGDSKPYTPEHLSSSTLSTPALLSYSSLTGNPKYKDPKTENLDNEEWRKPRVDGNKVKSLEGTNVKQDITIINHGKRNTYEELIGDDGVKYGVRRDENGFPEFTVLETYLPELDGKGSPFIGSGKRSQHFKGANSRVKELLVSNPRLKDELGLNEKQYKFFMKKEPSTRCPPDLTWHHHQNVGKLQLVNLEKHNCFKHTGGHAIWGGGK